MNQGISEEKIMELYGRISLRCDILLAENAQLRAQATATAAELEKLKKDKGDEK